MFAVLEMDSQEANKYIEAFEKRFGEPHLYLAYHAAFPIELVPDLAYCLWHRFQCDIHGRMLGSHWTAVSDLLLYLCDEVGHELYRMPRAVRIQLLKKLQFNTNFGEQRIRELHDFLLLYVQNNLQNDDPDVKDFAQAQRLTALAYVYPDNATSELAIAFKRAFKQDTSELFRIASITKTLAEPLTETLESRTLLTYAQSLEKLAHDDIEGAANQLRGFIEQDNRVQVAGIRLNIPLEILQFLDKSRGNTPASDNPSAADTPPNDDVLSSFTQRKEPGHFSVLRTKMTDGEILKTTLRDLGITVKIEADVRGYNGQRVRTDIVAVLEGEYDLGWGRHSDGSFDLIGDLWGIAKKYNQTELINSINQKYRVIKTLAEAKHSILYSSLTQKIKCPRCDSTQTIRYGYQHGKQSYKCSSCGTQFTEP